MTADTKLLPERFDCTNGNTPWCQGCYTMTPNEYGDYVQWEDYERIAAAKDAEIERLRAEARQEQDYAASAARRVLMAQLAQRRAEARAERLAEALRDALECGEDGDWQSARNYINEALRDHDQEVGDG